MSRFFTPLLTCIFALTFLPGCGESKPVGPELSGSKITGKLLQSGKPIKILKDESIRIAFIGLSDNDGKITGTSEVKDDGSFEIVGPSGKGLPAGKYKVTLTSEIYGGGNDRFFEKMDVTGSQVVVEIGATGTENYEVDIVTKKAVKK